MKYTFSKPKTIGITLSGGSMSVSEGIRKVEVEDGAVFLYESANAAIPVNAVSLAHAVMWGEVSPIEAAPKTDGMGNPVP
jgi:hypothetical protein